MKRRQGIALVTIIMVSAVLLAVISVGLQLGSSGVLFASQIHKRNVALAAAEAGVYEAMAAIAQDRKISGDFSGTLSDSKATYSYSLSNRLQSARDIVVVSTGEFGNTRRTLRVVLEPDSAGFYGTSLGGKVYVFDQAYVNAVASANNPVARPGNVHSDFSAGPHSFVSKDYDGNGQRSRLHGTGKVTARADFDSQLQVTAREVQTHASQPGYRLDYDEMTSGTFSTGSVGALSSGGTLSTNTRITGGPGAEIQGKLFIPKGVTLHVENDIKFLGGLSGEGQLVVDGNVLIRTDSAFDPSIAEGVKVLATGSAFLTHPHASASTSGVLVPNATNTVGDFFAQLPLEATYELSTNLPVAAPRGGDFFSWFNSNVDHPDANFQLWYNGDGSDVHPGLSEETKSWLDRSRPIHQEIREWADAS